MSETDDNDLLIRLTSFCVNLNKKSMNICCLCIISGFLEQKFTS